VIAPIGYWRGEGNGCGVGGYFEVQVYIVFALQFTPIKTPAYQHPLHLLQPTPLQHVYTNPCP